MLREDILALYLKIIKYIVSCRICADASYQVDKVPSLFFWDFSYEWVLHFDKCFFYVFNTFMWFFFFGRWTCWNILIDFFEYWAGFNHGNKSHLIIVYNSFSHFWSLFSNRLLIFFFSISMHCWGKLVYNFLILYYVCLGIRVN